MTEKATPDEPRVIIYTLWWWQPHPEDGRPVITVYASWTDPEQAYIGYEKAKTLHPGAHFEMRLGYTKPPYDDPHDDPNFVSMEEAKSRVTLRRSVANARRKLEEEHGMTESGDTNEVYGKRPVDLAGYRVAEKLTPIIEELRDLAGEIENAGGDHFTLDSAAIDIEQYAAWLEEG